MKHAPPVILAPLPLVVRASMIAEALADAQLAARLHDRKAECSFILRVAELLGAKHATTLPDLLQAGRDFVAAVLTTQRKPKSRGGS